MDTRYRIIFSGQIIDGFDLALVKKVAALRLKATPEQIERLFLGRKAIIKKNVSAANAERYRADLTKLGLVVGIEAEKATQSGQAPSGKTQANVITVEQPASPGTEAAAFPAFDPLSTQLNAHKLTATLDEASPAEFDPNKTHINLAQAEELLNKAGLLLNEHGQAVECASILDNGPATEFDLGPLSELVLPTQEAPSTPPQAMTSILVDDKAEPIARPLAINTAPEDVHDAVFCPHCGGEFPRHLALGIRLQSAGSQIFTPQKGEHRKTILQSAWAWLRSRSRSTADAHLSQH